LLGLHPQSERPFEILDSAIPGLEEGDLLGNKNEFEKQQLIEDDGSIIQGSLDGGGENQ